MIFNPTYFMTPNVIVDTRIRVDARFFLFKKKCMGGGISHIGLRTRKYIIKNM